MSGPTRHNNQLHRSEDSAGNPITTGYIPSADGSRNWVWVDPVVIAGTGGFAPTLVGSGETFTVPINRQALFTMPIDVVGILVVDGYLVEVS